MKKQIGNRIRQIRLVRGFNQDNVADELKMSVGNYGKIERGEVSINVETLQKLSVILGVSPADIFEDQPITTKNTKQNNLFAYVTQAEFQLLAKDVEVLNQAMENIKLKLERK